MLKLLDLPPELLLEIYYRVLDSTHWTNRHLTHLDFGKTCRTFKNVAGTRIYLYVEDGGRLARLGEAIEQWDASRCSAVHSIVLADLYGGLNMTGSQPDALSKLIQLQLIAVEIGDLRNQEEIMSFNRLVCNLGTLTTLNLNFDANTSVEVTAESVVEYLRHLPELRHLVLPFITTPLSVSSYLIPPHSLHSLKLSLNGLRGCNFLAALLPVLPKLDSLFLGLLPNHYFEDSAPINEIDEVSSDFDDEVIEGLAGILKSHGQTLETFGFAAAVPYGWWYSSSTWEHSYFIKIYEVLPSSLQHILVTPHGIHLRSQLAGLSNQFPHLHHLTFTSETLPDDSDNSNTLVNGDLFDLIEFCKNLPALKRITFRNIGMYRAPHGTRWDDWQGSSLTWAEMEREAAALNVVIENVDQNGSL